MLPDVGLEYVRWYTSWWPSRSGEDIISKAVAGEAGVNFFSVPASQFVEIYVGVGASCVRALYQDARDNAPSVIFIDELDAVGRARGLIRGLVGKSLLVWLDGFEGRGEIITIASTKRRDILDAAVLSVGLCGEDIISKAVAGEAGVNFFSVPASQFVEIYVGVGASCVRALYQDARDNAPSVIFIDELDAVGRARGLIRGLVGKSLLVWLDGFEGRGEIITIASTKRRDILDAAGSTGKQTYPSLD
ncbi:ATP-dependent zinc metalloprotease FtsH-like [Salvia splendens]|uniref:ATP-dependent zinc metalloprotease FtsH-like n=1 Tax=Salvia splendens TaxID=180675 RepID=UPI001C27545C|nr:ATP-dependent zinc metalloprotease FtsH-like [Salvia splendens]